jgi:hypothetical protein
LGNSFEQRFANSNSGNPLVDQTVVETAAVSSEFYNDDSETDSLDRGVSNVLSLAERVRNLQSGMKKA